MNPINIIKNFISKGGNIKDFVSNTASGNPMLSNLIGMANNGDVDGVRNFARNLYKDKGLDFDKEFSNFMNNIKR